MSRTRCILVIALRFHQKTRKVVTKKWTRLGLCRDPHNLRSPRQASEDPTIRTLVVSTFFSCQFYNNIIKNGILRLSASGTFSGHQANSGCRLWWALSAEARRVDLLFWFAIQHSGEVRNDFPLSTQLRKWCSHVLRGNLVWRSV
jgi:hypothetical protein